MKRPKKEYKKLHLLLVYYLYLGLQKYLSKVLNRYQYLIFAEIVLVNKKYGNDVCKGLKSDNLNGLTDLLGLKLLKL